MESKYTEPLTAISQIDEANFPKKTLTEIVAALAPSLEKYSGLPVPNMGNTSYEVGSTNWGSGNRKYIDMQKLYVPVDVILGEMYLEDGQWLKAAQHYCKYLADNRMVSQELSGGRRNFGMGYVSAPEDYSPAFNLVAMNYFNVYANVAAPLDVVSYIPLAVSSQRGQTTDVPLAFGYDYYSTDPSSYCPRVDNVQIIPSPTYFALTDSAAFYYYPYSVHGTSTNPDTVKLWKNGDARANYQVGDGVYLRDQAILNRDMTDTTRIYVGKAHKNANIYLYRESTLWLHLAEAFNRMEYPELAFAILRNGISTYLEELVPGAGDVYAKHQYMTEEAISLLTNEVPFLNAENRNIFVPEYTFGIHHHGGGTRNGAGTGISGIENNMTVQGSQATAVGSKNNHHYLPSVIIGEKMAEIARTYGVAVGTTKEDSINAMEDILCDEYAKEFAFEGVRFYDLQRMARHKNEAGLYGADFGSRWFADKLKGNNPAKSLLEPKNWYLPFK